MDPKMSAKSLGVLSRSVVNKNVNLEDLDALPLPQILKDECFVNVARTDGPARSRSLKPCKCCFFTKKCARPSFNIPRCMGLSEREAQLIRLVNLPDLPTDAEWLALPDRKTLLERYLTAPPESYEKSMLQVCLNPLRFDPSTGLGQIHTWFHRFLYQNHYKWYHLSIINTSAFLETMKNFNAVVLPYGYISEDNPRRRMMMVVHCEPWDEDFEKIIFKSFNENENECLYIEDLEDFIEYIVLFSTRMNGIVFNPILEHAICWMYLLLPNNELEDYVKDEFLTNYYSGIKPKTLERNTNIFDAATELEIENCVVRFEPLHQCIGDPVLDMDKQVVENKPFVYWFRNKVLNVTDTTEPPSNQTFVQWCISRGMNTLLNLNGDCWVDIGYNLNQTLEDFDDDR